jgi:polyisoprenoid-binding protein YceI
MSHYLGRWRREKAFRVALLVGVAASPAAQAQSLPWQLDPQHTKVWWEVKHFGTSTHRGRFDDVEGQLRYDRASGTGELSVTVGTASVTSGVLPLDGILRGEYFFASKAYPKAYYVSRKFRTEGGRLVALDGELTLRDVSTSFTLRAIRFGCYTPPESTREVCGGDFEGELRRSEFGMTYGWPFVEDRVRIIVQAEAASP